MRREIQFAAAVVALVACAWAGARGQNPGGHPRNTAGALVPDGQQVDAVDAVGSSATPGTGGSSHGGPAALTCPDPEDFAYGGYPGGWQALQEPTVGSGCCARYWCDDGHPGHWLLVDCDVGRLPVPEDDPGLISRLVPAALLPSASSAPTPGCEAFVLVGRGWVSVEGRGCDSDPGLVYLLERLLFDHLSVESTGRVETVLRVTEEGDPRRSTGQVETVLRGPGR